MGTPAFFGGRFTNRYIDQGTSERLSKFWMPLDQFTTECMEKLKIGGVQIAVGAKTEEWWDQFEKGKLEAMARGFPNTRK